MSFFVGNEVRDKHDKIRYGVRRYGFAGFRYYIPLDNTYVLMQMCTVFIMAAFAIFFFLFNYKTEINDSIMMQKKVYQYSYLIILVGLFLLNIVFNLTSKEEKKLFKRITYLLITSICIMMVFFTVRLVFDSKYDKNYFIKEYNTTYGNTEENNKKDKISMTSLGAEFSSNKEMYLSECNKLYTIFKIKTYGLLAFNFLLSILLMYEIVKIQKMITRKNSLEKDDVVVYDEEENVKM